MLNKENVKLGIAPLTWTNDDLPELGGEIPFEQCVSEMALAGFTGCEVGTKFPRDPAVLKPALELRGLQVCNAWFSPFLTTKSFDENRKAFEEHCAFLQAMGSPVVNGAEQGNSCQGQMDVPVWDGKGNFSDEEWTAVTRGLDELGKIAREQYGLRFCYHHHMGTGVQTIAETERLLENTKPENVSLCYDTGHFFFSFEDPVEALQRFISRIGHVHLKDVRAGQREKSRDEKLSFLKAVFSGVFTVPGDGVIDFPSVFKILGENDYKGWVVVEAEQDPAKAHPLTYAKKARDYIRRYTGI